MTESVFNRSLKKVATMAAITKSITKKVGIHTFTDTMIGSNKLRRSFVSKMFGHK